jgi:hypothetical protein
MCGHSNSRADSCLPGAGKVGEGDERLWSNAPGVKGNQVFAWRWCSGCQNGVHI